MTPALLTPPRREFTPIEDATRREFITGVGAAALAAAFLAACGDDAAEGTPRATVAPTRKFRDALGNDVEAPVRPERIVAMHSLVGAQLLALGGSVAGIASGGDWPDYLADFDLTGVVDVGSWNEPDTERIIALAPDLIVLNIWWGENGFDGDLLHQLRSLAPLVFMEHGHLDGERMPADKVAPYAELIGTDSAELGQQEAEYQALVGAIRELLLPDASAFHVGHIETRDEGQFRYQMPRQGSPITHVLLEAGVTWAYQREPGESASLETLGQLETDLLVVSRSVMENLDSPLLRSLPVVEAGQAILTTEDFGNLASYPSFIAGAQFILDQLRAMPQPLRSDLA